MGKVLRTVFKAARRGALLGCLFVFAPLGVSAQTSELTPQQMRQLAAEAVVNGNPTLGYSLAGALLQRNPNDVDALVIRARAARDMGRTDDALKTARRATEQATTQSEKFGASMVMAQALSTSGAQTRAQFWLRRAAQIAPNQEFKDVAVRDFRYVQRTNPWSTELSFSTSPSSNINNGSARSTTKLFDLPFEFQLSGTARALSGVEHSGHIATRYRLSENAREQNDVLLRLGHRTYTMSEEAKLLAPRAKGSDFAFSSASLSYIRRGFTGPGNKLPNQFELTGGRTWYAHDPFMQFARVSFTQNYVFSPGSFVFAGASRELQRSLSTRQDLDSWGLNTGVRMTLPNRDQLTLVLSGKKSNSIDSNLDYTQVTVSARYALGQPILGARVDFGISASQKKHELSRFTAAGRLDKEISVDVTALITQIQYFGFSPSVTLSARRNNSNIGLYETRDLGLQVGIQSAF